MLIALFGSSSVGKTTLAQALATQSSVELRGCGDIVRSCAKLRGVPVDAVADGDHRDIDAATREWCAKPGNRIVEGRFLDQVLQSMETPLILIKVVASDEVRGDRWCKRLGQPLEEGQLAAFDDADAAFRLRSYDVTAKLLPDFVLDTSDRSVELCLEELTSLTGW